MKQKYKPYIWLTCLILLLVVLGMRPFHLFGSTTDWLNQHTVFPEYFRNLFYETKQLIPSFAFHLGTGQNIFHFSYYGLLSPLVLLSYALPFVSMTTYLQIVNVVLLVVSVLLFYQWIKKKVAGQSTFLGSCLFACAVPLVFQAHRHFMFVDYMPFLILGLMGIDRYFEKGYKSFVTLAIFLMIMTSYYYSIGGLLVLAIYYIYCYLQKRSFSLWSFIKDGCKFLIPYFSGILLAGVLLLPTVYVVLHGRGDGSSSFSLLELFLPKLDYQTFLYDSYGLGLTFVSLLALIGGLFMKKRSLRFLSLACLVVGIIPIFMFALNGTLYIRSKVLIPFLPLYFLLLAQFMERLMAQKKATTWLKWMPLCLILGIFSVVCYRHEWYYGVLFLVDIIITLAVLHFYSKNKNSKLLYIFVAMASIISIVTNQTENYVSSETYQNINSENTKKAIQNIQQNDSNLYRMKQLNYNLPILNKVYNMNYYQTTLYSSTQNRNYDHFYRTYFGNSIANRNNLMISSTSNLLYDSFMGVKYVIGEEDSLGYQKVDNDFETIYENTQALPIMYATSHLLSEEQFDQFTYPYQSDLLLQHAIVKDIDTKPVDSHIKPIDLSYEVLNKDDLQIEKRKDSYVIDVKEKTTWKFHVKEDLSSKILFLQFDIFNKVGCEQGDRSITINGKVNKLTCDDWLYKNDNYQFRYVFGSQKNMQDFEVVIDPGRYEIGNVQMFVLDYQDIVDTNQQVNAFVFDQEKTKGDHIAGSIDVLEDGYFVTSIPYDDGFQIMVDGEEITYEMVNKSFVGFPISKGHHEITMTYQAPLLKEGKMVSVVGVVCLSILVGSDIFLFKKKKRL